MWWIIRLQNLTTKRDVKHFSAPHTQTHTDFIYFSDIDLQPDKMCFRRGVCWLLALLLRLSKLWITLSRVHSLSSRSSPLIAPVAAVRVWLGKKLQHPPRMCASNTKTIINANAISGVVVTLARLESMAKIREKLYTWLTIFWGDSFNFKRGFNSKAQTNESQLNWRLLHKIKGDFSLRNP